MKTRRATIWPLSSSSNSPKLVSTKSSPPAVTPTRSLAPNFAPKSRPGTPFYLLLILFQPGIEESPSQKPSIQSYMAEVSLLASASFSPGIFHSEPCLRHPKEFQTQLPVHGKRQEISRSGSMQLRVPNLEDPWQPVNLLSHYKQLASSISMCGNPVIMDLQDGCPDSVLLSFENSEQCIQQEETLKLLVSGSSLAEGAGLDIPLPSDHLGLHTVPIDKCVQAYFSMDGQKCLYEVGRDDTQYLVHPKKHFLAPNPLLDFVGRNSNITVQPDGRVLFTGNGSEMKDLLSIVAEFSSSNRWTNGTKRAMIVPYFAWSGGRTRVPAQKMQTQTVTPVKSPRKSKVKQSLKNKQSQKAGKERDMYRKNYFHACECLLSAVTVKRGGTSMLSLTKSGPEINDLLVQFSAGIAGTGLAILFSVVFKVGIVKRPVSAARLLTTGFGLGLFWLSCAVNGLRDTITHITKNSSKLKLQDDEIVGKVERSMNVVLFRAAALMVVAVLRFV